MICFCYFWKKIIVFFVLGVIHNDFFFVEVDPKMAIFKGFISFFRTTRLQLNVLISIESPNILHWKPANKNKVGVVFGQNLDQIRFNVV